MYISFAGSSRYMVPVLSHYKNPHNSAVEMLLAELWGLDMLLASYFSLFIVFFGQFMCHLTHC